MVVVVVVVVVVANNSELLAHNMPLVQGNFGQGALIAPASEKVCDHHQTEGDHQVVKDSYPSLPREFWTFISLTRSAVSIR